ncbi:hypothetical protein GCM10010317_077360 [Streptomyces mirabilis]|uniref:hypothetical protein n=1 Tax=Streptomyces mirabilis TaxID=68239 RepID=UPI00167C5475|nr:hypothetical protein [Streptomyces mirabilis]GHD70310.1 hypothetical protein GCM10010317_077360 [Streptomyces mirabilis]
MSYIPTAPDLKPRIADTIRAHRKRRDNGGKWFTPNVKDREEAGQFNTAGGALILVEAVVEFTAKYVYAPPSSGEEHRIEVGAVAKCHGNGCTGPEFEQTYNNYWLLDEDADEAAARVMEPVQAAREWAQAHAERCRAQAYTR